MFSGCDYVSPVGTNDNSPAIYRWETCFCIILVPQGRLKSKYIILCQEYRFFRGSLRVDFFIDKSGISIDNKQKYAIKNCGGTERLPTA